MFGARVTIFGRHRFGLSILLSVSLFSSGVDAATATAVTPPPPDLALCRTTTERFAASSPGLVSEKPGSISQTTVVKKGRSRKGIHGGRRTNWVRVGPYWLSIKAEAPNAPQGNPFWIADMYGVEAAKFLGMEKISDTEITLPNAREINGAIRKINRILIARGQPPILVKFYAQKTAGITTYLVRFENEFGLPYAPRGGHRVHDFSYHVGAALASLPSDLHHAAYLSKSVREAADAYRRITIRFAKRSRVKQGSGPSDEEIIEAANYMGVLMKTSMAEAIDGGTADLVPVYVSAARVAQGTESGPMNDSFSLVVRGLFLDLEEVTPMERYLSGNAHPQSPAMAIARSMFAIQNIGARYNGDTYRQMNAILESTGMEPFEPANWIRHYIARKAKDDPQFKAGPPIDCETGCLHIVDRIAQIRSAIAEAIKRDTP